MNKDEMTTKLDELLEKGRGLYWELGTLGGDLKKYRDELNSFDNDIQRFVIEAEEEKK